MSSIVQQSAWAESQMGREMRHQMSGQKGIVVSWVWGKKFRGVWFLTENGLRIYRQFPKRLQEEFITSY